MRSHAPDDLAWFLPSQASQARLSRNPRMGRTSAFLACRFMTETSLRRAPLLGPVPVEQQLLDAIGVEEIVKGDVPEHDEDGVVAVLPVLGGLLPFRRRQLADPGDEALAVA